MRLTKQERDSIRRTFRKMSPAEKADYIVSYYKPALLIGLALVCLIGSLIYRQATKKETYLYSGLVNVSAGSDLQSELTEGFLSFAQEDAGKSEIELYQGLVLTDDPSSEAYQYVHASRLKVLAAIESKQLDVVLMNQEAYDTFSQSGYLSDLSEVLQEDDPLFGYLVKNLVIYEDNAEEHAMDETIPYRAVSGEESNALDCTAFPVFQRAGFTETVYLGIIKNSPRKDRGIDYLRFLSK
jgi:hypothetical protein